LELGAALTALGMEGKNFSEYTLSVVIYDEDRLKAENAVAEFQKLFTQHDGLLYEERYNLLNAFFATIPGNRQFNLRKQWALNSNYADLSFLFTLDSGSKWNSQLDKEHLAVFETVHGTPYYLNLHSGDVAHGLITGATGSGKSFLMSFLLQSAQKYQPLTIVFDLGASYEMLTRTFGGTYLNVGLKTPGFSINPFSLGPTHENLNFLYLFLQVLIEAGGRYELTTVDEKALYAALERVYKLPAEIRTLTNFASILDPLGERLHRWTQAGVYPLAWGFSVVQRFGKSAKGHEVFKPTIGNPQRHHSAELFRSYGFDRISAKMRCWEIKENGVVDLDRPRRDAISKADVYLNGDEKSASFLAPLWIAPILEQLSDIQLVGERV